MISDKERFMSLLDKHQGILINLCAVYYHTPADQQDAFQDIALQLWKSFKSFRGEAQVSTWIYKVSLNTLLTKRRKEKRKSIDLTSLDQALVMPSDQSWGNDDDCQLLMRFISMLNDKDKATLVMHLEGYSNKEIAATLSTSQTNISTRINRAKVMLRGKLKKIEHGD